MQPLFRNFALLLIWSVSLAGAAEKGPRNLLPNASFELGLGQGIPTHWADPLNDLTFSLRLQNRPLATPSLVRDQRAPHGSLVARLDLPPDRPRHLTSAVVTLDGARGHVLSAYARSDTPGARLRLSLWTRPLDWSRAPDALSPEWKLTSRWKRYEFRFIAGYRAGRDTTVGVVDLVSEADQAGQVWFDAVQLEAASLVSDFQPRHPVEVSLSAQDQPHHGMLHAYGTPLQLDVKLYNNRTSTAPSNLTLTFSNERGEEVQTRPITAPIPPGFSRRRVNVEFGLVGRYQANCRTRDGSAVDVADYHFLVRPLIDEHEPAIWYAVAGKVDKLPAERIDLDWTNEQTKYSEPSQHLVVDEDGTIFVCCPDGDILCTRDGGRTWDPSYEVGSGFASLPGTPGQILAAGHGPGPIAEAMGHMSVMRDGSFLCIAPDRRRSVGIVKQSRDHGRTWKDIGEIPDFVNAQTGPPVELKDGTYVVPIGMPRAGFYHANYAYRSTDRGKTWSSYPLAPGGEPFVRELRSGRLLAVVRFNVFPPPDRFDLHLGNKWNWIFWQRALGGGNAAYSKNLAMLDSDDRGITWKNPREVTRMLGTMHGSTVELPDGRIVLIHCSRGPWKHGGERARVSRDGGNTWQPEKYYLHTTPTYPGYSASCLLPPKLADGKPGMILTIVGNRRLEHRHLLASGDKNSKRSQPERFAPPSMQAVRWRPLP